MQETGTWPSTSGAPRTRLCQRPNQTPSLLPGWPGSTGVGRMPRVQFTGLGNISPPGTSKLPVRMLTTSTSQLASVPNSWLHKPMRP